jgi:hypothetical protein
MAQQPPPNLFYDPNLPPGPYFTLGPITRPHRSPREQQRRQRLLARARQRRRVEQFERTVPPIIFSQLSPQHSLTVVEHQFPIHFTSLPPILRWLPRWFLKPGIETTILGFLEIPAVFFEFMGKFRDVHYAGETVRYLSLAIMILRMRWAFKRLVNAAILRSINRRRPIPQIDPISLEPMNNPVVIYSVGTRWRYAYDPTTLIAYIRTQLSTCMYGYPEPQAPRNPITNMEFTIAQLYSAYMQLAQRGKLCWQLGAYLAEGGRMHMYERQYVVPIYRQDCIREARDPSNLEGATSIVEFITDTIHGMRGVNVGHIYSVLEPAFYSPRLRNHPYLDAWRKLYMRSLVECSAISVDTIVLLHGSEEAVTELAEVANQLVRCFPAFCEDVKPIMDEERAERVAHARTELGI